ncbi:Response regulator rcp1 [Symmachiella macrocystis]|uniref:Response regulator rcp1 n=1 Tax=Symmachiella macrocystis TaxID=2527985 RepID=A0A5C6BI86_9PLAN|nr:response regulator [Symmachiella macrocystis]TWU11700.1 Response regulator rcp1 [Symmachiella macrocystis]
MNSRPLRILLADDNTAHAKLVMRIFADHRLTNTVEHVTDGEATLDYLLHRCEFRNAPDYPLPDAVLLDLNLPKIDGLNVLKSIRETDRLRRLPVIILSTSNATTDVTRAYELGANSYLVKPTDFEQFSQMINDLGDFWLHWNRSPWATP